MGKKFGLSFSAKRALGISAAKGRISRSTGIPLTRQGRQRKIGRMATGSGCLIPIIVLLGIIVLAGLALLTTGCAPAQPAATVTVTAPPVTHTVTTSPSPTPATSQQITTRKIKEWSGSGIKTTESFAIKAKPWAIRWVSNPQTMGGVSVGMLQIMVFKTTDMQLPITLAANTNQKASDVSYVQEAGEFYLTINAANANWTVEVWANQ